MIFSEKIIFVSGYMVNGTLKLSIGNLRICFQFFFSYCTIMHENRKSIEQKKNVPQKWVYPKRVPVQWSPTLWSYLDTFLIKTRAILSKSIWQSGLQNYDLNTFEAHLGTRGDRLLYLKLSIGCIMYIMEGCIYSLKSVNIENIICGKLRIVIH